jgi:hypothetical protein
MIKHILVAIVLISMAVLSTYLLDPDYSIGLLISFLILAFLIFNLIIRKSLRFKNYFTSKLNILTSKVWHEKVFDIPQELLFEKILEVIAQSNFQLADSDKEGFVILATSRITFKSWGENLYISFENVPEGSKMKICSATFFQVYSWGKNEKNCELLLSEIENSFVI